VRLTPACVKRLSSAFFPRPRKPLLAVVGGEESAEFKRQTALIRDQWGPTGVPVCETIPSANHFTVLHGLADPNGRLHRLALGLLGLKR
jgi:arylformamidase